LRIADCGLGIDPPAGRVGNPQSAIREPQWHRRTCMPDEAPKRLVVVGDRVLIAPEEGEERTNVGLYLPATALESRQVQGGRILATGPGTPMTEPAAMDDEPWKIRGPDVKYLPMQARVGDYALFFRKAAVELTFEDKRYLVVPQAAILVLVRKHPEMD
jgi:co-chaperonin GroES (HSP10)